MHQHAVLLQQAQHQLLLRDLVRYAHHGVPATFAVQDPAATADTAAASMRAVALQAAADLLLDCSPHGEDPRRRVLHRGADGEKRVRDELQPIQRLPPKLPGPPTWIQDSLSCGSPTTFENPFRTKVSAEEAPTALATRRWSPPPAVVGEHLVHDERAVELPADGAHLGKLVRLRYAPVGLLGLTTTMARVLPLMELRRRSRSILHPRPSS